MISAFSVTQPPKELKEVARHVVEVDQTQRLYTAAMKKKAMKELKKKPAKAARKH